MRQVLRNVRAAWRYPKDWNERYFMYPHAQLPPRPVLQRLRPMAETAWYTSREELAIRIAPWVIHDDFIDSRR